MAIAQRFPTISISPVSLTSVSSVTVELPLSSAGEAARIMDTILVDDIDNDGVLELIYPAFAGPYPGLVESLQPVYIFDWSADGQLRLTEELSYQSSRRALTLGTDSDGKALVFIAFTDVWPETAPGTLFVPSGTSVGYTKTLLNDLQTHGPSVGRIDKGGPDYVVIPAQWDGSGQQRLGVKLARLNSEGSGLDYFDLGPIKGQEIDGSASALVPATGRSGAWVFVGQSYWNGDDVSDVLIPVLEGASGPVIDTARQSQIFNDYWNITSNRTLARDYPEVATFDAENPQNLNDYSHVVTAEVADLNSDGFPDVIAAHAYRGPSTNVTMLVPYIQQDGGRFQQLADQSFLDFNIEVDVPYRLFVQDINGDGHVDIVFSSEMWDEARFPRTTSAGIYLNDGTGQFAQAMSNAELLNMFGRKQVAVASFGETVQYAVFDQYTNWTGPTSGQAFTKVTVLGVKGVSTGPYGIDPAQRAAPGFNELYYLNHHADAFESVQAGLYQSGLDHYLQVGHQLGYRGFAPGSIVSGTDQIDILKLGRDEYPSFTRQGDSLTYDDAGKVTTLIGIERVLASGDQLALDLDGNAGNAARVLATVFGKSTVSNPTLVGIALSFFDQGMSLEEVSALALSYAVGDTPSSEAVVRLLWGNVIGSEIDSESLAAYSGLIDSGQMSAAQLTAFAAGTDVTAELVNLTGLAQTGLEYA